MAKNNRNIGGFSFVSSSCNLSSRRRTTAIDRTPQTRYMLTKSTTVEFSGTISTDEFFWDKSKETVALN